MKEIREFNSCVLTGIPAAPGMASGLSVILSTREVQVPQYAGNEPVKELQRLENARAIARGQLAHLKEKISRTNHSDEAAIFDAHMLFVDDLTMLKKVEKTLQSGLNAEAAWMNAIESFAVQLEALQDPTLKARAVDIRDVGKRVVCILLGIPVDDQSLETPAVVVASDLTPSQTANLDRDKVLAFCIENGGPTSHTAILAKALGIPAVVGLGESIMAIPPGSGLLVDGNSGQVIINPDESDRAAFESASSHFRLRKQSALVDAFLPAETRDGFRAQVFANIGGLDDADAAVKHGAEGVGLFRTEFLFLGRRDLPSEDEQVQSYKQVFERLGEMPIIVRTLDIGGDKAVSYIGFPQEANPFLGWRAIRMNDGRPDVFCGQVRALLRAGAGKDLRIMLPLVSNIEEIILARQLLRKADESLREQKLPCPKRVQFGIMVEIPSTALIADRLAPHVDFFSIGTNDLTQYTLAVDRTNPRVSHLASPYHPAVLRLIQMTIQFAHEHKKLVGVCGELAGDVVAVPLLLGLGLDEFSLASSMIPSIKEAIRKCDTVKCRQIAQKCLTLTSFSEVVNVLKTEAFRLGLL